jgi:hypothetical protein
MKENDRDVSKAVLAEVLGIEDHKEVVVPKSQELAPIEESNPDALDIEHDYKLSRETLHKLIQTGNDAVVTLADLADASQQARVYEVLATLIKTVGETTNSLYDVHKKTKEIKGGVAGKKILDTGDGINIDKAVFVGTTSDLLREIKNNK